MRSHTESKVKMCTGEERIFTKVAEGVEGREDVISCVAGGGGCEGGNGI